MNTGHGGTIVLIVALLLVSALFAAAEISFLSLGTRRAKRLGRGLAGRVLERLIAHPAATLSVVLVAITAVNYTAEAIAAGWLGLPLWVAVVGMALLVLAFSEAVPIFYAAANPERVARAVVMPVWMASWILFLPSRLFSLIANQLARLLGGRPPHPSPVTEGEIRAVVDLQVEAGGLEAEEKVMIHSIFEFGDKVAREVMVPRTDMIAVPETATVWDAARETTDHRLSRLPVYRRDLDDIVGLVHVNDLLPRLVDGDRSQPVSAIMKPLLRVPETRKLDDLLDDFRRQQRTIAIVVDEYGGTAGLVTLEDLLEEIVGDIWDEYDLIRPMMERHDDGTIEFDGRVSVDEASEVLDLELPEGEYDTIAGLIYSHLGVVPHLGDTVELPGVALTVKDLNGVRITRLLATLRPETRPGQEGEEDSQMNAALPWYGAVVVICLLLLALASLAEAALVRLELGRARQLAEERPRVGRRLLHFVEHRQEVLSSLILLINVAVIVTSACTTALAVALAGGSTRLVPIFSIGMIAFILIFCELTPKTYAVGRAEGVAITLTPVIHALHFIARPLARFLHAFAAGVNRRLLVPLIGGEVTPRWPRYTDEEVIELVAAGEAHGSVEEEEREMIEGVIEFADKVVREVMTPRTDIVGIPAEAPLTEAARVGHDSGYSRLPVYRGSVDTVVGILYAKDIVAALQSDRHSQTAGEIARTPAPVVPESKKLHEVLQFMQRNRLHMVIVIDEYGGTAGLATIEDLVEEIFGELKDEYDVEVEPIRRLDENTFLLDASVSVGDVEDELEVKLPEGEYDSIGGFLLDLLGRLPTAGEQITWKNLRFTVEAVSANRIQLVRLECQPLPEGEEDEDEDD